MTPAPRGDTKKRGFLYDTIVGRWRDGAFNCVLAWSIDCLGIAAGEIGPLIASAGDVGRLRVACACRVPPGEREDDHRGDPALILYSNCPGGALCEFAAPRRIGPEGCEIEVEQCRAHAVGRVTVGLPPDAAAGASWGGSARTQFIPGGRED